MADFVWISTDGNYNTAGSWSPAGPPNGGTVLCKGSASNVSMLTNVDRTADLTYQRFVTDPEYSGDIGSGATPLMINTDCSTAPKSRIIHRGTGTMNVTSIVGSGGANIVIDSPNLVDAALLSGHYLDVLVKSGKVTIAAGTIVTGSIVAVGPNSHISVLGLSGSKPNIILAASGATIISDASATTSEIRWHVFGGTIQQRATLTGAANLFYTIVINAGTFIYSPVTAPGGSDNPSVYVDGTLDVSQSRHRIVFSRFIKGPSAIVFGTPYELEYGTPLSVFTDLTQEYP